MRPVTGASTHTARPAVRSTDSPRSGGGPGPTGRAARARGAALSLAIGVVLLAPGSLRAQQPTKPVAPPVAAPDTTPKKQEKPVEAQDTTPRSVARRGVSPKGAFLRAMAIPGWGHAAIGSYKRGAFYFVAEGLTAWELVRTSQRITAARDLVDFRTGVVRGDLAKLGITDPVEVQDSLSADTKLSNLDSLVSARKSQKEDWTAMGIFLIFLSGADAYVSAHLQHFPVPLSVEAQPAGGGRMDLALSVKLPRRTRRAPRPLTPPTSSGTAANPPPGPGTSDSGPSRRR